MFIACATVAFVQSWDWRLATWPLSEQQWYSATIVHMRPRARDFTLHFDDGLVEPGVTLPDDSIRLLEEVVTICSCARCRADDSAGRALPIRVSRSEDGGVREQQNTHLGATGVCSTATSASATRRHADLGSSRVWVSPL